MLNLHLTFDYSTYSQKFGEDFAKFCGLLRIYELYAGIVHKNLYALAYFDNFLSFLLRMEHFSADAIIKSRDLKITQI